MAIPEGYEGQIRPRSGLAVKCRVVPLYSPCTIDSDYRGEIVVYMINMGSEEYIVRDGYRIAQMVIAPCIQVQFNTLQSLQPTDRGTGGFGSTGI